MLPKNQLVLICSEGSAAFSLAINAVLADDVNELDRLVQVIADRAQIISTHVGELRQAKGQKP